jgi:cyclic pyranopterin phosphate synthase
MAKITYLRISVTDRCNFRCKYCMPSGIKQFIPHEEVLRYEEIIEITKAFSEFGIEAVRITGGEPLVKKQIETLIEKISQIPEIKDISMTTNGYKLKEMAAKLKKSGLNRVNVSVDSLKKEKFKFMTGVDGLEKVIEGIRESIEQGLNPVKVNTVLIRGFNDDEIEDFVIFSDRFGVDVRFIELMPVGGKFFSKEHFIAASEMREKVESMFGELEPIKGKGNGPAKLFKVKGTNARIGFITAISEHFCDSCNRLRLTSDGKLRLCLMRDDEIDLKSIIRGDNPEKLREAIRIALERKSMVNGIEALKSIGCDRKMFTIGG